MAANTLHCQALLRVLPVSLCLMTLVGAVAYRSVSLPVVEEVQNRVDVVAYNRCNEVDAKLKLVAEACLSAAKCEVLVHGLVDQEYRNAVTRPFIRSFRLPGSTHQEITLTDYRGRPIAGTLKNYENTEWIDVVMTGQSVVRIVGPALLFATPVNYARKSEAAFVVEYSLSEFLQDSVRSDSQSFVQFHANGSVVASSVAEGLQEEASGLCDYIHASDRCQNLPELGVTVLEQKDRALRATTAVRHALLGIAGIVVLGFVIGIWYVAYQVANPVRQLLSRIQLVQETGDPSLRVVTAGSLEFVELGNRLNAMLSSLEHKTVSLDRYQASRQQLKLALRGGNIGTWDWNAQTNRVEYSDIFKQQLGFPPDVDWSTFEEWRTRLHPADAEAAQKLVEDYFSHRTDRYETTFRMRCQDGAYKWIYSRGVAQFDEQGTPLRMIGVHVDIHERVENEEELKSLNAALSKLSRETQAANRKLQASNDELEQFAYVASHDLQEPLRKVAAFCQLLEEEYAHELAGEGREYIESIVRSSVRMKDLIRDLLSFSRVKSQGDITEAASARDALDAALENLSESIERSGAEVTSGSLPKLWIKESHLTQVFQNLIGNAIKYQKTAKPEVQIEAKQDGDRWVVSVRDNGIGIAPEYHEQIFGVFKRLHNRRTYQGTGIGLAICKRVMDRWDGRIWLKSSEGKGSTFFFSLPANRPVEDADLPSDVQSTSHPVTTSPGTLIEEPLRAFSLPDAPLTGEVPVSD